MIYTGEYSAMLHPVNYKKYELPIFGPHLPKIDPFGVLVCAAARV